MSPTYRLAEADTIALFAAARVLIQEYGAEISASMSADLCFQNFAAELEDLPAMYGPPTGCLLLAGRDDEWVGCCGLRRFSDEVCEMKRLSACALGYQRMVLDTLADMNAAQALYRSFGFRPIQPYYLNPIPGASYMELELGTLKFAAHRS